MAERGYGATEGEAAARWLADHLADRRHARPPPPVRRGARGRCSIPRPDGRRTSWLGTRDHVPALLGGHPHGDRIAVGEALRNSPPSTEEHLASSGSRSPRPKRGEEGLGLGGALQGGDVHPGDPLAGGDQGGSLFGLFPLPATAAGRRARRRAEILASTCGADSPCRRSRTSHAPGGGWKRG